MEIAALEAYAPKERLHIDGAFAVANFHRTGRLFVGDERAVVVERLDEPTGIAEQGIAQALLQPFGTLSGACRFQPLFGFGEERFRFAVLFEDRLVVEFFFDS